MITFETYDDFLKRVKCTILQTEHTLINNLIESMPRRFKAVVKAKGLRVNYWDKKCYFYNEDVIIVSISCTLLLVYSWLKSFNAIIFEVFVYSLSETHEQNNQPRFDWHGCLVIYLWSCRHLTGLIVRI